MPQWKWPKVQEIISVALKSKMTLKGLRNFSIICLMVFTESLKNVQFEKEMDISGLCVEVLVSILFSEESLWNQKGFYWCYEIDQAIKAQVFSWKRMYLVSLRGQARFLT